MPPQTPSPAPWKSLFAAHISKLKPPTFVLSTLSPNPPPPPPSASASTTSASASATFPFVPRARTVVFRGFWAELPHHHHHAASAAAANPHGAYESELLTLSTDVRMRKVGELFASAAAAATATAAAAAAATEATGTGTGTGTADASGSGGGGPVEAVWWVEEAGTQWRVKGRGFVVWAGDIDGEGGPGAALVKREVGGRMRAVDEAKKAEWSWSREVLAHFGNHTPAMRGTFRQPPPGQPTSLPFDASELAMGKQLERADDPVALRHFRVVVLVPDAVERTDLSDPSKARRWLYTFADGEWRTEELWP